MGRINSFIFYESSIKHPLKYVAKNEEQEVMESKETAKVIGESHHFIKI